MTRPIRVLHVAPSYFPATRWGGPIVSTRALNDALAHTGDVILAVLATDSAGPERAARLDPDAVAAALGASSPHRAKNAFTVRFPAGYDATYVAKAFGRDVAPGLVPAIGRLARAADLVHLTATYSFPTVPTLAWCRMLGKPLVWSPRGALQARVEWAGAQSAKKRAFEALCRRLLPARAALHVTAEVEARLSAVALEGVAMAVIPNPVPLPEAAVRPFRPDGTLRLMFLSRLHPKKGLELLIEALAAVPDATLCVYGDGEPAYRAALAGRVAAAGLAHRVRFCGHVEGAAKSAAFHAADLFVLPSYSENFGNVVAEALAHGVPVLTTTATPWQALEPAGCGVLVAPEAAPLAAALGALARLAPAELAAMGARGRALVTARFAPPAVAAATLALYRSLLG